MDVSLIDDRKKVLKQVYADQNFKRKAQAFKAYRILNFKHAGYVEKKLEEERGEEAGRHAKKFTSINIAPRMIDELASIYKDDPKRTFSNVKDDEAITDLYKLMKVNKNLKRSNRYLKALEQCEIQIIAKKDKLKMRVLPPYLYDIIEDPADPEDPIGYLTSDYTKLISEQDKKEHRFSWWTDDYNFITDGEGNILSDTEDGNDRNPISRLPFASVKDDEGFKYWAELKDTFVQFAVEFGALISSVVDAAESQGFGIAVLAASQKPEKIEFGIHKAVFLKIHTDKEGNQVKPEFGFQNANPDLAAFIDLLEVILRFFLTSHGIDPKKISGKLEGQTFTSGVDRLLSMIQSFEASRDDFANFEGVEQEVFSIIKAWQENAADKLGDKYRVDIPKDCDLAVEFKKPEMIQTKAELLDYVVKQKEHDLITWKEAIQQIRNINEDMAEEVMQNILDEKANPIISKIAQEFEEEQGTESSEESISQEDS